MHKVSYKIKVIKCIKVIKLTTETVSSTFESNNHNEESLR